MKFLLDTNFLLIPGTFKVDIFAGLENFGKPDLYTVEPVIKEIEKLSLGKGSDSRAAKLALSLIEAKGVSVIKTSETRADRALESLATSEGYIVCTQDKALKAALKKKGLKTVTLRQKKTLIEE